MIELILYTVAAIIRIYLSNQKLENEKKEDFEERDN